METQSACAPFRAPSAYLCNFLICSCASYLPAGTTSEHLHGVLIRRCLELKEKDLRSSAALGWF